MAKTMRKKNSKTNTIKSKNNNSESSRKLRNKSHNKTRKVFKKVHYNSNDGMLTTVWGPGAWHFLHTISFNYPVKPTCDDKRSYRDFILNLRHTLPCKKCRENLCANFRKLPLEQKHMKNRTTFSKYVYQLHEVVNQMLGKKSGLSYSDVRERYEHFRARCGPKPTTPKVESGCTEPIYGEKSKCVLKIVPQTTQCETFQMDDKCKKRFE